MSVGGGRRADSELAWLGSKARLSLVAVGCAVSLVLPVASAQAAKGVLDFIGSEGVEGGQFSSTAASGPGGVAVNQGGTGGASAGDVYILDRGNRRVQQFRADGAWVRAFGLNVGGTGVHVCEVAEDCVQASASAAAGGMNIPQGIAIEQATGNVFVTDQNNKRVDVFSAEGVFEGAFGRKVQVTGAAAELQFCTVATGCQAGEGFLGGSHAGQFRSAGGGIGYPAIDPVSGHVLVADRGNIRIDVFEPELTGTEVTGVSFVHAFGWEVNAEAPAEEFQSCTAATDCKLGKAGGGEGQFASSSPSSLAIDSNGRVYALDTGNQRVQIFDSAGNPLGVFAEPVLSGAPAAVDLAVDTSNDHVLAAREGPEGMRVLELDSAGALLDTHVAGAGIASANGVAAVSSGKLYLTVKDAGPEGKPGAFVIGSPPVPPQVEIEEPTEIAGTTATLKGKITTDGIEAGYHFEYSDDGSTWTKVPAIDIVVPGDRSEHVVSAELEGLVPLTDYQARLVASKAFAGGIGSDETLFSTTSSRPKIAGTGHSALTDTAVTLDGFVNPENEPASYRFQYLTQADYEANGDSFEGPNAPSLAPAAPAPIGSGNYLVAVSERVSDLEPATTYRYRLTAENATGSVAGELDESEAEVPHVFTTYSPPQVFAGTCPGNEAFRGAGTPSAQLPDCRAYEQATPVDKGGGSPQGNVRSLHSAADGSAVTFESTAGVPGGVGAQNVALYLARRGGGESGWSTQGLLPPATSGQAAGVLGWAPGDFNRVYSFATKLGSPGTTALFARSTVGGEPAQVTDYLNELSPEFVGAATSGSPALFQSRLELVPAALAGKPNLYLWDGSKPAGDQVVLAGVLNDGQAPPSGAIGGSFDWIRGETGTSLAAGGAASHYYTQDQHVISGDGRRVFFTAAGSGRLYVREDPGEEQSALDGEGKCTEAGKACTIQVNASQRTDCAEDPTCGGDEIPDPAPDSAGPRPAAFMAAAPGGSSVFFTSAEKLTDDANTGPESPTVRAIARAGVGGGEKDLSFLPATVSGVGVAIEGEYVYWTDAGQGSLAEGTIGRAKLDGSEAPEPEFIVLPDIEVEPGVLAPSNPRGIAVIDEPGKEYVYWTNAAEGVNEEGTIGRAALNGGEVEEQFVTGASNPQGIAAGGNYVYWANRGTDLAHRKIARATLSGVGVNQALVNAGDPRGLALDAEHLYWANNLKFIRRIDITTEPPSNNINFITDTDGTNEPEGLAVDAEHLYWANSGTNSVARAKLSPSLEEGSAEEVELEFIPEAGKPGGLAADASHLYWSANQEEFAHPGNDLYRFDVAGGELTDVAPDKGDENGAEVQGLLGASADGSYVYFAANGVPDGVENSPNARGEEAEPGDCHGSAGLGSGTCGLYLAHGGDVSFIATLDIGGGALESDAANWAPSQDGPFIVSFAFQKTSRVTPDGHTLLFRSRRQLTAYDSNGTPELYLYEAGKSEPACVSCNPTGAPPTGAPRLGSVKVPVLAAPSPAAILSRNLSEAGDRVFFEATDPLVPADTNGEKECTAVGSPVQQFPACGDVYEWEASGTGSCQSDTQNGGCLYLLSSGKSPEPSFFIDASAGGDDAFVLTSQSLVGQDGDALLDVYDVRVNGGLALQNPAPPPACEGEACKGAAPAAPAAQAVGSADASGPVNRKPTRRGKKRGRKKKQRRGHRRRHGKKGKKQRRHRHRSRKHRDARTTRRAGR